MVAVLGLGAVWWRITRGIGVRWLQNILRLTYFSLLVTPCLVVDGTARMAPAFMIYLLESTIVKTDDVTRVYAPIAATLTVALCLAFAEAIFRKRSKG